MLEWPHPPDRGVDDQCVPPERSPASRIIQSVSMVLRGHIALSLLLGASLLAVGARGEEAKPCPGPGCAGAADRFFVEEIWEKIGARTCITCHKEGGDAEESQFVLHDPKRATGPAQEEALRHNREAFARMARLKAGDQHRLLLKVTGGLDHGGADVLKADSTGYRLLADFVRRVNAPPTVAPSAVPEEDKNAPPFFEGVVMLDDARLLRRVTLSLAGRLPSAAEAAAIAKDGLSALPAIMDAVMQEEAFYARIREGFNDIFLTVGYADGAESALSYEHFSTTRHWTQKHNLDHIADEKERQKARYKLADDYRAALLGEPMKLVEHIVRNEHPFTEIVTADYIMVTPYTARGYGIYDEVKEKFQDPEDPFEYIPVKLKALVGRNRSEDQPSETGFYPHAGMLTMFQYLRRYPTTETNRNRLRSRMYYQHFLGIDALELAARVSDAAAVTAKFEVPTMQASECVVCHKTLDPVSSLFQDYYNFDGVYGRRKGGWFKDMFQAGFEGEDMPEDQRWRSLQWLGERTAKDPRFATTMVEHVYYILTGRKVLLPPKELDDPLFTAKRRAYQEQRRQVEAIATRFAAANFNLKTVFKNWAVSDFYRADGVATAIVNPARKAELDDVGLARMLSPEQIERKVAAIFGQRWGKLTDQLAMLYGGIDSKEVTERAADPSGAMGSLQRILANDVACKHTLRGFAREPNERLLFAGIEPDVVPGASPEADASIREAIANLHERILGRQDAADSAEVDRTFQLFAGIVSDAKEQKGIENRESYYCRNNVPDAPSDPHYTIRAWRGVITYLLRRQEFLYE